MPSVTASALNHPSSRPVVLIVDDYEDSLAMYALVLTAFGFDVTTAKNGVEASASARETRPDIIVSELAPPDRNQWRLLGETHDHALTKGIPVVIVTAYSPPAEHARAMRQKCAAFFTKPCQPEQLAIELWRVVSGG